jgi:DNA-binding GntR family transcriptional regulator
MKNEQKGNLKNKIIEYICNAILNGEYKQNDQIKEVHLANKLNVSRIPIREALLELVYLGILKQIERRGVFVKEVTSEDILNTYQAQGIIEGFLATSFATFATQEEMDTLDEILTQMCDKKNDSISIGVYGRKFHEFALKYATNTILLNDLERINKKSLLMFSTNINFLYNSLDDIKKEHQKIVDALKSREKNTIERVIKEHYFRAGERMALLNRKKG